MVPMAKQPVTHLTYSITYVRQALTRPLPGPAAQLLMMPAYRVELVRDRTPPPNPRKAGVLILLYPRDDQLYFPLTQRTETLESHRGQVSLPGGAWEPGESLEETAWRETCEELNICPDDRQALTTLTPLYVPPSGFLVHPFVAFTCERPDFQPDTREVAELIETPLSLLLDRNTVMREEWIIGGMPVKVPFFDIQGHKVWGATAMILSELVALLTARYHNG
jgi:8-oxo-dGTP pyrophosphatase MutT (NUDIX family)